MKHKIFWVENVADNVRTQRWRERKWTQMKWHKKFEAKNTQKIVANYISVNNFD